MRVSTLVFIGVLIVISVTSCLGQNYESASSLKGWGTYADGNYKFAVKFPPVWGVTVADRQWLKGAGGMHNEEAEISFSDNLASFNVSIYPNPQHLSSKQWFDKEVKEAGKSWGGKWSIISEHQITINGQKGYTVLMKMPDSKDKRTYLTWGGWVYMIYYSKWWPLMTAYERNNYEHHYAMLESMLQTFRKIE